MQSKPLLKYKPLKGHHPVSFVLLRDFEQVVLTVKQFIPEEYWSHIRLWRSSDDLQATGTSSSQYWIQLQPPVRLNCQQIKGYPFIAKGEHFQAGEMLKPEKPITELGATEPCLVWLEFGELKVRQQKSLKPISCSKLLNPLAASLQPLWQPNIVTENASTVRERIYPQRDTHSMLALEQLKTGEAVNFVKAMRGEKTHKLTRRSFRRWPSFLPPSFLLKLFSAFAFWRKGSDRSNGKSQTSAREKGVAATRGSHRQPRRKRPIFQKLSEYWQERLMRSHLGSLIGRRQARYLHEMMQHFKQGDLTEALKMAVPLSDYRSGLDQALSQQALPALGLPAKRQTFEIGLRRSARVRKSYGLAEDSYAKMRSLYEKAYQQLKQTKQHKEAAFVLAELLNRIDEAIDYLAKQGFLAEAAEISEHRSDRIDKTIQLWVHAGEIERAIALAIRSNKFKSALLLLKGDKQALPLESLWIQRLIDSGDFETLYSYYADNTYPKTTPTLKENRLTTFFQDTLPRDYLKRPVWLARYLCTQPWHRVETEILALLQHPLSDDYAHFWNSFLSQLNRHQDWKVSIKTRVSQPLLKEWYRQAVMYYGHTSAADSNRQLNFLSTYITDRLFISSRPKTFNNAFVNLPDQKTTQAKPFQFYSSEALITDIAITDKGQVVVAMGALGIRIYDEKGRFVKQLSTPAHSLVSPTAGTTIIAVERREKLHRVHRVPLHTQTAKFMGQQPIAAYSRKHNGATWPVGMGNRVSLIDVVVEEWSSLWKTNHIEGSVRQIVSDTNQITFLVENEGDVSPWQYRLPQLRLASRAGIDSIQAPKQLNRLSLSDNGEIVGMAPIVDANRQVQGIEFYQSSQLKTYKKIAQVDPNSHYGQPLTLDTVRVVYSSAQIFIVAIEQSPAKQLIQAYKIARKDTELLFEIETPVHSTVVQHIWPWIAIGQGDQFLLFDVNSRQNCLVKIS